MCNVVGVYDGGASSHQNQNKTEDGNKITPETGSNFGGGIS